MNKSIHVYFILFCNTSEILFVKVSLILFTMLTNVF